MKRTLGALVSGAVLALALAAGSSAEAASTSGFFGPDFGAGSNAPGVTGASYKVTITYEDTIGLLTLDVLNNSNPAIGGFMTAFVFNTPGGLTLDTFTPPADGDPWTATGPVNANPYGTFDLLTSATNSQWDGGGQPQGLAPGEQQTFTYDFSGAIASVDIQDFVDATTTSNKGAFFFVGRFRGISGLDGSDSDKLPNGTVVPIPGAAWLFGTGLIALAGFARRKRAASA